MKNAYDKQQIDGIRTKLAEELISDKQDWKSSAIQYLLSVVEEVVDENESLWFMLDEEKNSKPKAEHSDMLNKIVANRLTYLKLLQGSKGEA